MKVVDPESRCRGRWLVLVLACGLVAASVAGAEAPEPSFEAPEETRDEGPGQSEAGPGLPLFSDTLVVTASRVEQRVADAPVSLSVIGEEQLSRASTDSYAELLRGVPGVNAIQMNARQTNFTTRAATDAVANSQLVLLDGRSVYQDYTGWVLWDYLPISFGELEQIEILRGPGSAVWGASALTGVINLRTKSPSELAGGEVSLSAGERDTFGLFARWAEVLDGWSYKVSAGYLTQDAFERPEELPGGGQATYENEGTEQIKLDFRADFEPDEEQRWSFWVGAGTSGGIIHTPLGPAEIYDDNFMAYSQLAYTRGPLEASLYVNRFEWEANNIFFQLPHEVRNTTIVGDVTNRTALGSRHVLVYGLTGRQNLFEVTLAPDGDDRSEIGGFVEDQMLLSERVVLTLGARLDWFDTIGTTLSPRTSLILRPHPGHSLRLSYGRAYRPPTYVENYLDIGLQMPIDLGMGEPWLLPVQSLGNQDLDEVVSDSIELAYTWELGSRAAASLAVYTLRQEDLINLYVAEFYGPGDPPPGWPGPPEAVPPYTLPKTFTFRNIGEVESRGIELSTRVALSANLDLAGSYTWQDRPEVSGGDQQFVVNEPPEHQLSASLSGSWGRWFGSVGATYVDEAFWADVLDQRYWGTTDDYTLVDATVGVRLAGGRTSLRLHGTNLLDERAQQHIFGDIISRRVVAEVRFSF